MNDQQKHGFLGAAVEENGPEERCLTEVEWTIDETLQKKLDEKADVARREEEVARATPSTPPPAARELAPAETNLNPKYRFDNFIVGPSNQLAHAASVGTLIQRRWR